MTKHLGDQDRSRTDGARLREFLRIERSAGLSKAVEAVHRQPKSRDGQHRMQEFLRIEREGRG